MPPAIRVHNVAKRFRLFETPMQRLLEYVHPFGKTYGRDFWALEEVDFEVPRGQTIGILGRNGSGKSTLLQLICGVLEPTRGEVATEGRIAALLELGAGFNPDFTGRENVEFFGLQNGLSTREIAERIDEIEAFADVGEFFDRPMRVYSSGMFVRVAFAASIHVDPEILVVDEALSVGDARFQHKCFERFRELRDAGRTVVLVTHDTQAVLRHCDRAILLEGGRVTADGTAKDVVHQYIDQVEERNVSGEVVDADSEFETTSDDSLATFLEQPVTYDRFPHRPQYNADEHRAAPRGARIVDFMVVQNDREHVTSIPSSEAVSLYIKVAFDVAVERPHFGFAVRTVEGLLLYGFNTGFRDEVFPAVSAGDCRVCRFDFDLRVHAGDVFLDLGVDAGRLDGEFENLDRRNSAVVLEVTEAERFDGFVDLQPSVALLETTSANVTCREAA